MTNWTQSAEEFDDFIGNVIRLGWLPLPSECPYCSTASSVHVYFDTNPSGGVGTYWVWCSTCRRFEHGSIRPPGWCRNLNLIARDTLVSEPVALQPFVDEIDRHWNGLRQEGENNVDVVSQGWDLASAKLAADPQARVYCPICQTAQLYAWLTKWGDPAVVHLHMTCRNCNAFETTALSAKIDDETPAPLRPDDERVKWVQDDLGHLRANCRVRLKRGHRGKWESVREGVRTFETALDCVPPLLEAGIEVGIFLEHEKYGGLLIWTSKWPRTDNRLNHLA